MKSLLAMAFLAVLVGCGSKGGSGDGSDYYTYYEEPPENQYLSGNCGENVIEDYNDAVYFCRSKSADVASEVQECISELEDFKLFYPGVNCTAKKVDGAPGEVFTISESYIDGMIYDLRNL